MKKILTYFLTAVLALSILVGPTFAATTVVTATNPGGWADDSTAPSDVEFVNGPGTPPLGTGSAQFTVDATGATEAELRNSNYDDLALADITVLGYSTYVTFNNNEQAPYIILNVDNDNDGDIDDLLFFEPVYQDASFCTNDQGDVVLNTWQEWDALNGCWHFAGGPTTEEPLFTLADYIADHPDAVIMNGTGATKGGVRLVAGFGGPTDWGNFNGNVDAFTINDDTFDFELVDPITPTPSIRPPTSADACKNNGYMNFTDENGQPFRNQGQCVSYFNTNR